jgi:hypothetical protein
MNAAAPQIQSAGPPPLRHAERVTSEMLAFLHGQHPQLFARAHGVINLRQMGSLKGQQRTADRLNKALGPLSLGVYLSQVKRGRGTLMFADWSTWDPLAGAEADSARPPPPLAWLVAYLNIYRVANYQIDVRSNARLLVSRHAIIRLAQRADVRTINDLIAAMRELWQATFHLMARDLDGWTKPPDGIWRIPVGDAIAILEPDRDGAARLVCKTILDASMCKGGGGA